MEAKGRIKISLARNGTSRVEHAIRVLFPATRRDTTKRSSRTKSFRSSAVPANAHER